jgi:hypothetical protein
MPKNRIMNRTVADSINFSDEWFMCFSGWLAHEKVFSSENVYFEVSEFVSETSTESRANEIILEERLDKIDAAVHFHSKTIEHHHTLMKSSKTKIRYFCRTTIQIIRQVYIGRSISSSFFGEFKSINVELSFIYWSIPVLGRLSEVDLTAIFNLFARIIWTNWQKAIQVLSKRFPGSPTPTRKLPSEARWHLTQQTLHSNAMMPQPKIWVRIYPAKSRRR